MGVFDRVIRRRGYVKLAEYGLALSPDDRVVSLHDGAIVGRRAHDVELPPVHIVVARPPPRPLPRAAPQAPPPMPRAATPEPIEDDDWDWQIAIARARAAAEEIERAVMPPPVPRPRARTNTKPLAVVAEPSRTDRMEAITWEVHVEATPPPPQKVVRSSRATSPVTVIPVPRLPRASTAVPVRPTAYVHPPRRFPRGTEPVRDETTRVAAVPPANDDTRPDVTPLARQGLPRAARHR
jgi:hypothetical protein